jgi:5'-3' exonuclease
MGVPHFFAWLLKKYKKSNMVFQKENIDLEPIDWLLIDTNSLMHPKAFEVLAEEQSKEEINFKSLENKMINAIIEYIEHLINYVKPLKGVNISIDGPVCCAKIKQQRQRRFRSVHDKQLFDKIKEKHGKKIPYYWNNSAISPGTKFMDKFHNKILDWIKTKNDITIIYSSSNVPGEGEHKLLDFIKSNNKKNLDFSYITYGLDADLIFLMLVTKLDRVYLLREAQQFDSKESKDKLNIVSIKIMKDCILDTFNTSIDTNILLNRHRISNDFIFLCYFLGNDFLPHILALDISKKGVEYMVDKYSQTYLEKLDYILSEDTKTINQDFLVTFLDKIANEENEILSSNYSKIRKGRYLGSDEYEREMFKIDNLLFKIDDPVNIANDSNYRINYYKHYFDVEDDELEEFVEKMVKQYLTGLRWVTYYYFQKIPDWYYYYSYDYPPFLIDIKKYLINMNDIVFKENKPMTPFEQLLIILPSQSKYLLPKNFEKLVDKPESSIAHLYPLDFQIDFLYKRKYWEGIPILPHLEIKLVRHVYAKYKDELSEEEKIRNRIDTDLVFN